MDEQDRVVALKDFPQSSVGAPCPAVISFRRHRAFTFGPPNDEAFSGHPLASRGLHPYGAFEMQHSS